jgi:hypothetical protein
MHCAAASKKRPTLLESHTCRSRVVAATDMFDPHCMQTDPKMEGREMWLLQIEHNLAKI